MSKFQIGEVVRYSYGPTALMRISSVSKNHGGFGDRYYGVQYYGDSMGEYENCLQKATKEEIEKFETDDHIGRLRDYGEKLNPKKFVAKKKK